MKQRILNIRLELDNPIENVFHRISSDTYLSRNVRAVMLRPELGDMVEDWEEVPAPVEEVAEPEVEDAPVETE